MKNLIRDHGNEFALPVPAYVKSGNAVAVGGFRGVAVIDRNDAGEATVKINGHHTFDVDGAVANVGDLVYIDPANGNLFAATDTGRLAFGRALDTKTATKAPLAVALFNGPAQA